MSAGRIVVGYDGSPPSAEAARWAAELGRLYAPLRMLFAIPGGADLPPALAAKTAGRSTVAYVCTGMTCSAPMTDLPEISRALRSRIG